MRQKDKDKDLVQPLGDDLRIDHRGGGGESGVYSNTKIFSVTVPAVPDYGVVSIGGAPWDGTTSGFFAGSASGTGLAINTLSTFAGNFVDFQKFGVSKFSVSNAGNVVVAGQIQAADGLLSTPAYGFSGGDGVYRIAPHNIAIASNSAIVGAFEGATGFTLSAALALKWGSSSINSADLSLKRLATGALARTEAIPANANYAAFSVGSAPWDGTTTGFFTGSSSGTGLGVNAASGFAGDLFHAQVAGVSKFKVSSAGAVTLAGGLTIPGGVNLAIGSSSSLVFAGNSAITNGTGNYGQVYAAGGASGITSEILGFSYNAQTITVTGAYATQRFSAYLAPTITAASALTVTNAATLAIAGAPIAAGSAVITNPYALWVQAGRVQVDGSLALGTNILSNASGLLQLAGSAGLYVVNASLYIGNLNTSLASNAAGSLIRPQVIPANANYPAFGVGSGPFDGTTTGFFTGVAAGTGIGINAASGYTGDLINAQTAGVNKFKVDSFGSPTIASGGNLAYVSANNGLSGSIQGFSYIIAGGNSPMKLSHNGTGSTLYFGSTSFSPNDGLLGRNVADSVSAERIGFETIWPSTPLTITGGYTSQRFIVHDAPTITAASALTVTNAATLAIAGAPIAAGSAVITNPYALWVQGGISRFDGQVLASAGSSTAPGIAFTSNSNTGLWNESGLLTAVVASTRVFQLDSAGNLNVYNGTSKISLDASTILINSPQHAITNKNAPVATSNYALLNLGSGPFDGTTTGFFTGNAAGTAIAVNAATGYTGDLLHTQVAGVTRLRVQSTSTAGAPTLTFGDVDTGIYRNAANQLRVAAGGSPVITFTGTGINLLKPTAAPASTTASAGLNIPHGVAPTSPVDGDMWTTTAGLFIQINGVTKSVNLT